MQTTINSIKVPPEYVQLAKDWYDGQVSVLYAIASTGSLTTGNRRPLSRFFGVAVSVTDQEWYWGLFADLHKELKTIVAIAEQLDDCPDLPALKGFHQWATLVETVLYEQYRIENIANCGTLVGE